MRKISSKSLIGIIVCLLGTAPLGAHSKPVSVDSATVSGTAATPVSRKVWVVIKPLQCLGNPWEQDWIAHHKKSDIYPQRDEKQIIRNYFGQQQIQILDIRVRPYEGGPLCQTCDCPRGDILYLLVSAENASALKSLGFDKTLPAKQ